jgi:hypothetical protein
MIKVNDRIRLDVNMLDEPGHVTWQSSADDTLKIKLMNADVDLTLDLGPEVIRQLSQALAWVNTHEKRWF